MAKTANWLWRYSEETPFHGLSIAKRAWNVWEVGSWIVVVLVCGGMTIQQTVTLANIYLSEPTGTSTKICKNNTITFPNVVLCVNQPSNHPLFIEIDPQTIQSLLSTVTTSQINQINLGLDVYTIDPELIRIMAEIFRSITAAEILFVFNLSLPVSVWSPLPQKNFSPAKSMAVATVFKYVKENNISLEKLYKVVAANLCQMMRLSVSINWFVTSIMSFKAHAYNVCRVDTITSLNSMGYCVRLEQNNSFHNPLDYLQITANPEIVFPGSAVYGSLHLDLSGRFLYGAFLNKGNLVAAPFGGKTVVAAHIQGQYKSENLRRSPCSNSMTTYDCELFCYGLAAYDKCKCWPFAVAYLKPADINFCLQNLPLPVDISVMIPFTNSCFTGPLSFSTSVCMDKCVPDCEYQQVVFLTDSSFYYAGNDTTTALTMTVSDFVYPLLEERLTEDWQSILNEFGGNIGLWLGGSVVAIIHLPVFMIKCLVGAVGGFKRSIVVSTETQRY